VLQFDERDTELYYDLITINQCESLSSAGYADGDALPTCEGAVVIAELSGSYDGASEPSEYYISDTGLMEVRFTSDELVNAGGFSARWKSSSTGPCTAPCECRTLRDAAGTFGDGSGGNDYQNDADCMWKIISPSKSPVSVSA